MSKQLFYIFLAFFIGIGASLYTGHRIGRDRTRAEVITAQATTLKAQRSEIKNLKAQRALKTKEVKRAVEDIANKAHEKLIKIEMGEQE